MRTTSQLYKTLRQAVGSWYELQVIRGPASYGPDRIKSMRITRALFDGDGPQIGGNVAAQCEMTLVEISGNWPRMASFTVRLRLRSEDGTQSSEWLPMGVFYTDTRKDSYNGDLTIKAYDGMLLLEQTWADKVQNLPANWPITAKAAAQLLTEASGVTLENVNELNDTIAFVGLDTLATARQTFAEIAAVHGCNLQMTGAGTLRLVALSNGEGGNDATAGTAIAGVAICGTSESSQQLSADAAYLGMAVSSLDIGEDLPAVSGVQLETEDGTVASTGDSTGYVLRAACNFSDSAAVGLCMAATRGYVYRPFRAEGAVLDPAAEVGDLVVIGDRYYQMTDMDWTLDSGPRCDLEAPFEAEVDHEYAIPSAASRTLKKALQKDSELNRTLRSYIQQTADNIRLAVEDGYMTIEDAEEQYAELQSLIQLTESGILQQVSASYTSKTNFESAIQNLQAQIDDAVETYSGAAVPTTENDPAIGWSLAECAGHVGDLYVVSSDGGEAAGRYYRFEPKGLEDLGDTTTTVRNLYAKTAEDALLGLLMDDGFVRSDYAYYQSFRTSGFIPVEELEYIRLQAWAPETGTTTGIMYYCFYNSEKAAVGVRNGHNIPDQFMIRVPEGAAYMRVCALDVFKAKVSRGSSYTAWQAAVMDVYRWALLADTDVTEALRAAAEANERARAVADDLAANYSTTTEMNTAIQQSASQVLISASQTTETKLANMDIGCVNLIATSAVTAGKYIGNSGEIGDGSHWLTSDYIETTPGKMLQLQIWATGTALLYTRMAWYDASKNFLSVSLTSNTTAYWRQQFTVPDGAYYCRVCWAKPYLNGIYSDNYQIKLENGSKPTDWSESPIDTESKFAAISVTVEGIRSEVSEKVGETAVNSLIEQKADSIRLKAAKISWQSTNSSMTEDGTLTARNGNFSGTITGSTVQFGSTTRNVKMQSSSDESGGSGLLINGSGAFWTQLAGANASYILGINDGQNNGNGAALSIDPDWMQFSITNYSGGWTAMIEVDTDGILSLRVGGSVISINHSGEIRLQSATSPTAKIALKNGKVYVRTNSYEGYLDTMTVGGVSNVLRLVNASF